MYFDQAKADHVCNFFAKYLTNTKGKYAGKPFALLPWQKSALSTIFGTKKDNGLRQYKFVFIMIAKKNGKSELVAGLNLYALLADNELSAEV